MKKRSILFISVLCILSIAFSTVYADSSTWYCETCNADRDSEWCPICGAHRPSAKSGTWTCPTCGEVLSAEYNFCPNDRTEKVVSSNGSWPVRNLAGVSTTLAKLQKESDRHQSFLGPNSKSYNGAGAYKPYKVTSATALFRENNYVLVDMSYSTVGRRCVYFRSYSLTNSSVEEVNLTPYPAKTISQIQPYYGPGTIYDIQSDSNKNAVTISAGTSLSVFFEMNGWVFAEYQCTLGLTRGWLPADQVVER